MSDPKRLLLECESDFEKLLLRAGRAEAPLAAKQRALLAFSAGVVASGLPGGAVARQSAAAAKAGSVVTLQWLAVAGAIGVGAVATAAGVRSLHRNEAATTIAVHATPMALGESPPVAAASMPLAVPAAASESVPLEPITALPAAVPRVVARSAPKSVESTGSSAGLPVELAMLDRARSAMGAGEMTRALSILDAYAARFPRGAMAPEAAVLRVEALVKAGDRPSATRFANAFLASAPHSPYAARIQSLLSASNP